jgi:hypothetical protein
MNKINLLLSIHQTLLMATCHFVWQASSIVYFTLLLPAIKDIHNERHYRNKIFFIKRMINTLCNMFPSKFEKKYQVCGGHMSVLGKKRFLWLWLHPCNFKNFVKSCKYIMRCCVHGTKFMVMCKGWKACANKN